MTFDIPAWIGAVDRQVRSGERDGRPTRMVAATRTYDTTVDDLWDAITNPERIPRWFLPISGDLRLGGRYALEGNASGEITTCDAPRHLAVTWEYGGGVSWLEVRLSEDAGSARLALEHVAHVDGHWETYGPGATGVGWDLGLMGLARHLASGAPVDPAAAAAWTASDDGRTFMRLSSEGWRDAAIADGADETVAREAAERTTAAYSGEG